jgi:hypothetical protein
MLSECPKFEGAPSEFAQAGLARHKAIAAFLQGNEQAFDDFGEEEQESLIWAADYIKLKAPMQDFPLVIETKRRAVLPNGVLLEGTPDICCGNQIFDLKWRPRDYTSQMAAYAWMALDDGSFPSVQAHLLFAQVQTYRVLSFDQASAWGIIKPIIEHVDAPFAAPTPCGFCGWCNKKLKCEALIQQVNIAIKSNPEWDLPQWHSSEMKTAEEMGMALKIARTLSDWCDSVEFHAKEMAVKQGIVAQGFTINTRKGNRFIDDVVTAYQKAGLPQEEFLKTCTIKPRTLFDLYATFHGLKKAAAEREVERRLGETIQRKDSIVMLVQEKQPKS